jgi:hypothetical protein
MTQPGNPFFCPMFVFVFHLVSPKGKKIVARESDVQLPEASFFCLSVVDR